MPATITKPTTSKKTPSPYRRLHVIVPIEDMLWASQQKSSVTQLWQECWTSDPYGSRWMPLTTNLGYSTFIQAKKVLTETGLFLFKPDKSTSDGRETVGWIVRNLHGSRMKEFWEVDATKQELDSTNKEANINSEEIDIKNQAPISDETQSPSELDVASATHHEHITNSSKEFVMCDSQADETANAPLEGALPQQEEESDEESPAALDEKWSPDAIALHSKLRPMRREKLKMSAIIGESPGFDFLLSCWEDDPALHFVIKQLLVKFPQWRITCVDGKLVYRLFE